MDTIFTRVALKERAQVACDVYWTLALEYTSPGECLVQAAERLARALIELGVDPAAAERMSLRVNKLITTGADNALSPLFHLAMKAGLKSRTIGGEELNDLLDAYEAEEGGSDGHTT